MQTELNLADPHANAAIPSNPTEQHGSEANVLHDTAEALSPHQHYTVVLVSYNSQYWLEKHLPFYQTCQHLVIVDNASSDATCEHVRAHLPQATLISNAKNLGFGAACNQGAAAASTPYVLLLNPDCTCEHAVVEKLVAIAAQDPQAAIVAPQVMTKTGAPEVSYRMSLLAWKATMRQAAQGLLCVEFVTGACLLLRKAAFDAVSGFDEAYFMYYEDEDLCLRLRKAGFSIVVEPEARVQHFARTGSQPSTADGYLKNWVKTFKNEHWRGKVHTESKIRFYTQYLGRRNGAKIKFKLLALAVISLPFRILQASIQAKYLARALGRISSF